MQPLGKMLEEGAGVQRPGAIAPDDQSLGQEILHRTASRVKVKFNRTIVIGSKLVY